jgi:predicted house-cleaning NTP pyrophosphatase (Maf/HAM1 superfamily)
MSKDELFSRIEGDLFTVQGFPLLPFLDFLRVQGVVRG